MSPLRRLCICAAACLPAWSALADGGFALLLQKADFAGAQALIDTRHAADPDSPEAWSMRFELDDYHFAHGDDAKATNNHYRAFITKYAREEMSGEMCKLFEHTVYKFAQMLLMLKQEVAAADMYVILIHKAGVSKSMKRQAMFEYAELLLKIAMKMPKGEERDKWTDEANEAAKSVVLAVDFWFGPSVVLLARIQLEKGKPEEAKRLLEQYKPQLTTVPESRFLYGVILQNEADLLAAAGGDDKEAAKQTYMAALQEFVNVYARFPSSELAPEAAARSEIIIGILKEKYGAKVIKIPNFAGRERESESPPEK